MSVPISMGGSAEATVHIDGMAYKWTGALSWGHAPYGHDPIVWTCQMCGLLTADPQRHNRYHRTTDTEEA